MNKCTCCDWSPVATTLDLTEACNMACPYCFTHSVHKPRRLDESLGKRILDWWIPQVKLGAKVQISWWGGEPLLEWKMMQRLVKYSREKLLSLGHKMEKMEFGATTNGLLYTPDKVEWCLKNKNLMLVSLDGIKPAHDKYRLFPDGRGTFDVVYKNLKDAMKVAPQTKIRTSVAADTVQYLFESARMVVEDLGCKDFAFSPVYEGNWDQKALETLAEQYDLMVNYLVKNIKDGNHLIFKHLNDHAVSSGKGVFGENFKPWNPCGAGNGYSGWSLDGFMFPCHRFNKHGLSTEERSKLKTIIARPVGDTFEYCNEEFRKDMCYRSSTPDKCKSCAIYNCSHCNGSCYAVNYDLTGNVRSAPEVVCDISKILKDAGDKFGRIAKEEKLVVRSSMGETLNMNEPQQANNSSCICYNMCYAEGTPTEIISADPRTDMMCVCYNAGYTLEDSPSTRPIGLWKNELKTVKIALTALMDAPGIGVTERDILAKCVSILAKEHLKK
jgi:uncharacterized protein